jgi:hypothetical protein
VNEHLEQLLAAADLGNPVDRGMLADALEEAGRNAEAGLLRSEGLVFLHEGQVKLSTFDRHREFLGVAVAARGLLVSRADLSRL